jgi:CHASE3 domain sensor protein
MSRINWRSVRSFIGFCLLFFAAMACVYGTIYGAYMDGVRHEYCRVNVTAPSCNISYDNSEG